MTTDELNAIVQAVMTELEKAGVDFDFKAEIPQADDLVYVMRGTSDKYQGITVKWQNLLDIIVQKATEAKNEAVSAKDIALQTLATIQGIESNVSSMKSSVETSEANVASMKASVETSESNVTQMKSDVSTMKASVEGTKTEVEGLKEETAGLLNTKADKTYVDGELAKKVNYSDSLSYEEIMATTDLTNKVASANSVKSIKNMIVDIKGVPFYNFEQIGVGIDTETYFKAWLNKIFTDHKDVLEHPIIAHVQPNSSGVVIGSIYRDTLSYAGFVYIQYGFVCTFGYNNGTWYYQRII